MTEEMKQSFIDRLKSLQNLKDCEVAHYVGDDVLCEVLNVLGYQDIVEEWEQIPKWYA